jgi:hypothetical protein
MVLHGTQGEPSAASSADENGYFPFSDETIYSWLYISLYVPVYPLCGCYSPAIKRGLLENPPFGLIFSQL